MDIDSLPEIILAIGAVGASAMGITEGFKSIWLPPIGFWKLKQEMAWAKDALTIAYGENYQDMLATLFRSGHSSGELPRILRQGVRVGLNEETGKKMAQTVGVSDPCELGDVAKQLAAGEDISKKPTERNILGRFEMAVDARIDAALAMAERAYKNGIRLRASLIALVLSVVAAYLMYAPDNDESFIQSDIFVLALIVGFTAVPMAPIAKDVAKGFQAAARALGARK